ncbi:MAG TPA: hypothetical protein VE010_09295 [Thermoanaerobaculia bacterium]|nr:hypothetical protein [Thermoanaerobaculia bacterium]
MRQSESTLLALSRAEQEIAKRWSTRSRFAHVATLGATVITLFAEGQGAYLAAFAAFVAQCAAWALRLIGDSKHSLAEEGRRRAVLADALATPPDALAIRNLQARFSVAARSLAPQLEDPDYYASTSPPGRARLREHLQESAFWSRELYGAAAKVAYVGAAALFVLVVGALLLVVAAESPAISLLVARLGVLFLSFLVGSDIVTQGLAWTDASRKSDAVHGRLHAETLKDDGAALAVFGDYCVATATTPPIPTFVYRLHKNRIEEAWRSAAH